MKKKTRVTITMFKIKELKRKKGQQQQQQPLQQQQPQKFEEQQFSKSVFLPQSNNIRTNVNPNIHPPLLSNPSYPIGDTIIRTSTSASARLYQRGIPELTIEEQKDETKTIWGSDIVKYAVNQTNDFLVLEDLLFDTSFIFICPNPENNAKEFEHVLRNDKGEIIFYLQDQENWGSTGWSLFECTTLEFGFRLFNNNLHEVMSVRGKQCCYNGGLVEVRCGAYLLGTMNQQSASRFEGYQYAIKEANGQALASLKKVNSGHYDLIRSYTTKIGEIKNKWQLAPINIQSLPGRGRGILYGISVDLDMPTHEKHLILGSSFLLFYQKYRSLNNSKRCIFALIGKVIIILIILGIVSGFVAYYKT